MKKIFILLLILVLGLVGCTPKEPNLEDDIDQAAIDTVMMYINLLPSSLTEKERDDVLVITTLIEGLSEAEVALIENIEIYNNAITYYQGIDDRNVAREELFIELEAEIRELIPESISDNIELPTTYQTDIGEVFVLWGSSDYNTFSNKGVVTQGRETITIELITTLIHDDIRHSFKHNVDIEPIVMDPLPDKGLSVAYMTIRSSFTDFNELQSKTIDVVNYSFAQIVNGEISIIALGNLENLMQQRKKGIRILFSVGPYEDQFIGPASTAAGRTKLVDSLVNAVVKYHFDGVDIDWETPTTATKNDYTLMMEELHDKLKAINEDYLLTAATHSFSLNGYDFARLNQIMDFYNVMTYDLNARGQVTHNSALYMSNNVAGSYSGENSINSYISRGADKSKLVLGSAFYGKQYTLANPSGPIIGRSVAASSVTNMGFDTINLTLISRIGNGVTRHWDNTAKSPYLHDATNGTVTVYEDAEAIMHKANFIIDNDLKGIMYWQLNQDYNGVLLQAIYDYLVSKR
ncbi:MAG: glycoside hydrolase family 18 protein [Bacilli bacterium]